MGSACIHCCGWKHPVQGCFARFLGLCVKLGPVLRCSQRLARPCLWGFHLFRNVHARCRTGLQGMWGNLTFALSTLLPRTVPPAPPMGTDEGAFSVPCTKASFGQTWGSLEGHQTTPNTSFRKHAETTKRTFTRVRKIPERRARTLRALSCLNQRNGVYSKPQHRSTPAYC